MDWKALIAKATSGQDLEAGEAEAAFTEVMEGGASPVQISALLVALRTKGHASAEIAGGVRALRKAMVPVPVEGTGEAEPLVDTCGTGGGRVTTFNISTAAALVAAAAGARVAKHGNRSFTSRSGSADVLEALGVQIELTPEAMARVFQETGIVFLFAPLLHPAMRHVAPVRRELGIPTLMNLLGPLTNPAGARRQVVGVSDPELRPLVAEALQALGHVRALIVHGEPGMDEISPLGPTQITELREGVLKEFVWKPEDFGFSNASPEEISGGEPAENAERILDVLEGRDRGGARTAVVLNAAAALRVADLAEDPAEGVARAVAALDSGEALRTLNALRSVSRSHAG